MWDSCIRLSKILVKNVLRNCLGSPKYLTHLRPLPDTFWTTSRNPPDITQTPYRHPYKACYRSFRHQSATQTCWPLSSDRSYRETKKMQEFSYFTRNEVTPEPRMELYTIFFLLKPEIPDVRMVTGTSGVPAEPFLPKVRNKIILVLHKWLKLTFLQALLIEQGLTIC